MVLEFSKERYLNELQRELSKYGFSIVNGKLVATCDLREIQKKLAKLSNGRFERLKDTVREFFADSIEEIDPYNIKPRLQLIPTNKSDKKTKLLKSIFNYAKTFWNVPVSVGFGKRMDYILWDDNSGKVIGIFGLCDPVIGLGVRDTFIGWDRKTKEERLYNLMTAYVLGAVPPFNQILGAKLVALSAISSQVVNDFYKRYRGKKTVIRSKEKLPYLVAIDTMGAFGKSAIYTRLRGWKFVGYTKGQSHLHLTLNGVYKVLLEAIKRYGNSEILKKYKFGHGPNYKLRVVSEGLKILGLSKDKLTVHSIRRGYYIAPLAENWQEFLLAKEDKPIYTTKTLEENFFYWKKRWLPKGLTKLQIDFLPSP